MKGQSSIVSIFLIVVFGLIILYPIVNSIVSSSNEMASVGNETVTTAASATGTVNTLSRNPIEPNSESIMAYCGGP